MATGQYGFAPLASLEQKLPTDVYRKCLLASFFLSFFFSCLFLRETFFFDDRKMACMSWRFFLHYFTKTVNWPSTSFVIEASIKRQ